MACSPSSLFSMVSLTVISSLAGPDTVWPIAVVLYEVFAESVTSVVVDETLVLPQPDRIKPADKVQVKSFVTILFLMLFPPFELIFIFYQTNLKFS